MATLFETAMNGYNAADDMIKESRAYQAARKEYGDGVASDPGLFAAINEVQFAKNRDSRADQQLELNRRSADRQDKQEVRSESEHQQAQGIRGDSHREEGILNLVQGLRKARDDKQDLGEAFDSLVDTLPNLGVNPDDIPAMREQLIANPEILDQYYASLTNAAEQAQDIKNGGGNGTSDANKARGDVSRTIRKMRDQYDVLEEANGIVNPESGLISNVGARTSQSMVGRFIGGAIGSKEESARRTIEGLRPSLLSAMKSAEDMGAKMFDSQRDMELWLSTVSDPTQDLSTVTRLLDEFEAKYGVATNGGTIVPIKPDNTVNNGNYQRKNGTDLDQIYPGYVDPASGMVFNGGNPGDDASWTKPK